ncbi:response regulator transcription factor [Chryseobacterium nematophagum]|nr:response regulator transcription factor [Chryseobacterium nematophagum]
MKKTVLIADKHYVSIKGLAFILKNMDEGILIDHTDNKCELLDKILNGEYDLLILDVEMLGSLFVSVIKNIKDVSPNLKIMIFADNKKGTVLQYVCEGVKAVISKSYGESEIREVLESIFTKGYYYQQELLHDFIQRKKVERSFYHVSLDDLSNREREVCLYLIGGSGCLEIANKLGLHQSTVSIYKKRLFKKFHINSLAELINLYHKQGISIV